ncbi:MAG: hypothetical protein CMM50_10335 [Rhodospirillaceae bacterium]|nr:hypothetical protein [Rhodospirillaceae bacterium]
MRKNWRTVAAVLALVLAVAGNAAAQEAGFSVLRTGTIDDDVYLAGGRVDLSADVAGDAIAGGWRVRLGDDIRGDVFAAGGVVTVTGKVADDARLAGGEVEVEAEIGDDLVAAGGQVTVLPGSEVGGTTHLAGGHVDMAGTLRNGLSAAGGTVRIMGTVEGDAEISAGKVVIERSARITGDLRYISPEEAEIEDGTSIAGTVVWSKEAGPITVPETGVAERAGTFLGIFWLIGLTVVGVVLLVALPVSTGRAIVMIGVETGRSFGFGFVILVAVPMAAFVCLFTILGIPLGLVMLAVYPAALMVAYVTTALWLSEMALARFRQDRADSLGWRALALFVVLVILSLVGWIPIVGTLVLLFLLSAGLGGWLLALRNSAHGEAVPA